MPTTDVDSISPFAEKAWTDPVGTTIALPVPRVRRRGVVNHGTMRPGNSTGVMTVTGDYTQESDGVLVVEVAGTTAGDEYDQLAGGGAIDFNGLVEVVFNEGFAPQPGNRFDVITTAASVSGKFAGAFRPGLPEGMDRGIHYAANLVSLEIGIPGDYNGNNKIDAADYSAWRDALTAGATILANDSTPGTVDESDFTYWRAHFGETLGSGSGARQAAVPEPASVVLLILAAAGWGLRRRRSA